MSRVPGNILWNNWLFPVFRRLGISLAVVFFFPFPFTPPVNGQIVPDYQWESSIDLPTVYAGTLNTDDLTIAITNDEQGNIYTLSFGNGIAKLDSQGNLIQANFILAEHLDSPRDLVVDDQGFIYVADYLAGGDTFRDDGKIRVFDPSGNPVPERTILTSFYRPLGLTISGDHIYVAEYYDGLQGPEKGSTFSRVRIYNKSTAALIRETEKVDIPLRIATDSSGKIYVSQAGAGNPAVLIFDSDLLPMGELPNITSPGSIIVDGLGFIHVIEYGNRIRFSEFINFESLDFGAILNIAEDISKGIANEEFFVKIFNPDGSYAKSLKFQVDFPVDLSQVNCGKFYIDNADIFGSYLPFVGYYPSRLEFEIEVYARQPSYDATEGPQMSCSQNIEVNLETGETTAVVNFPEPTATDNCGVTIDQTGGLASGSNFPIGENNIEFTAQDAAGNTTTCSFMILVKGEEMPPQFVECPSNREILTDSGECGVVVLFDLPEAFNDAGEVEVRQIEGLPSGTLFPVGETLQVFEAVDERGNKTTCSYSITVVDEEAPVLACPPNLEYTVDYGVQGRIVEYELPSFEEACPGAGMEQTAGLASGAEFPVGSTENIFVVTDSSGNSTTCKFTVTIRRSEDNEAPVIECPADFSVFPSSGDCTAVAEYLVPEATDNAGEVSVTLLEGPDIGETIGIGKTSVKYLAIDVAGNTAICEFTITVVDETAPEIENCPGDQAIVATGGFTLPDYSENLSVYDCSGNVTLSQIPPAGTAVYESTRVSLFAEDEFGNRSAECSFEVILSPEEVVEITFCPSEKTLPLNENCILILPDLRNEVETNIAAAIVQEPAPGTAISEEMTLHFTATDSNGNWDSCEVTVSVEDTQVPELSCPGNKEFSFDPEAGFVMPDFRSEAEATDNCSVELIQDPEPGTKIYSGRMISITVVDDFGNESFCEFELRLTEDVSEVVEITSCLGAQVLKLDAQCEAVLPDYTTQISTNILADIVQEPAPGTAISEVMTLHFTATDSNGNWDSCEVTVSVEDTQVPELSCPGNKEFSFDPEAGFVVPDFRSEAEASDNCSFELIQDPEPGTKIYSGRMIFITAVDDFGNESFCEFELRLTEDVSEVVEITSCPGAQVLELDAQCEAVLPDYTTQISTNISADIVQEPAPGTAISEEMTVHFTATDLNGNWDSCEVIVNVEDTNVPEINCPGDMTATWNPEEGYLLPDFTGNISVLENCGGTSIVQYPSPGTVLLAEQEIKFTVTDSSGNSVDCSFWLDLSEEEILSISCPGEQVGALDNNCAYSLEDFSSKVEVNMENALVTQEPVPGTELFEDTRITITATFEGQQTSCSFDLNLKDHQPPQAICVETFILQLNEQGTGTVTTAEIDNGSTDNCGIVSKNLSKTTFSIADVGEQSITLTVIDSEGNESSCESKIIVEAPEDPGIECVEAITLELNANRRAFLDPRDLFSGGTGTVQFTVDKEEFSCADIGEQKIVFSYVSPTEEGACEITVTVEDPGKYCQIIIDEPEDPGPFVILSPNPGYGLVQIFTSGDITVQRAEIYDMRGRFLFARNFAEESHSGNSYSLDLRKYQSGVYTIKLDTNSGKFIRRAIIKND